jgi:hypothetical protein
MNLLTLLRWLTWFLLFIGTFLFVVLGSSRRINIYDEGLILEGANRVANGELPHRDFYANYGPAQFFVLAVLFKTFTPTVLVERIWDALVRTATAMLVVYIAFRFASRFRAYLAFVVCLIWLVSWGKFSGYPVFPALLFTLVSVVFLLPWFDGQQSPFWLACAGVAIALVTLFRYDVGFFSFVAEILILGGFLRLHPRAGRQQWSNTLALISYVGGTAVILIPVAFLYWAAGMISAFWFDVVSFPLHTYASMRSLPFPIPRLSTVREHPGELGQLVIYFLPCAWATVGFYLISRDRPDPHATNRDVGLSNVLSKRTWSIVLLCTLSIMLSLKGLVRVSGLHLALAIVPAIVVFSVVCDTSAARKKSLLLIVTGLSTFLLLVSTAVTVPRIYRTLHQNLSWLLSSQAWATPAIYPSVGTCRPSPGLERIACFTLDASRIAAIEYLQKNTRENEPIFVGVGRHDKIFVNNIAFYFVAKRRPATKWYHFDPGLQTSEKIQREIILELETVQPRYIVFDTSWDDHMEPNRSAISSGVLLLDDYIWTHYKPVAMFERMAVMKRM